MLLFIEEVAGSGKLAVVEVPVELLVGLPVEVPAEVLVTVAVSSFREFGRMVVIVSLFNSFVAVVSVVEDSELAADSDVALCDLRRSINV